MAQTKIKLEQIEDLPTLKEQIDAASSDLPVTGDTVAFLDASDGDTIKKSILNDFPFVQYTEFTTHHHNALYAPIAKGVTNGDNHDHNGGDGAPLTHASIVNRTRTIAFPAVHDTVTAIGFADLHGSLAQDMHFHLPNSVDTTLKNLSGIPVPYDVVSGGAGAFNMLYSSTVGGGNFRMLIVCREVGNGGTVMSSLYGNNITIGAPSSANTMLMASFSLVASPTPGRSISFAIVRFGNDAADTNTGTMCFWGAWVEYTADM